MVGESRVLAFETYRVRVFNFRLRFLISHSYQSHLSSLLFCSRDLISSGIDHSTSPLHLLQSLFSRVQDLYAGLFPLPSDPLVFLVVVSPVLAKLPSSQRYPLTDRQFFSTFVHFRVLLFKLPEIHNLGVVDKSIGLVVKGHELDEDFNRRILPPQNSPGLGRPRKRRIKSQA
ncbi:hypothetical protein Cgig2_033895 [Carnegiea gigantea]|uniref:Uncharacterized protein n=1 Tax=Carnegiea gigantea TaxID=171969 RepID=A0A9Q1GS94_9CARY|nr:hypothetical protein Cgig2_033895 [Carnegiea gigantea]